MRPTNARFGGLPSWLAAVGALLLSSATVARQDASRLVPEAGGVGWTGHLVEARPAGGFGEDLFHDRAVPWMQGDPFDDAGFTLSDDLSEEAAPREPAGEPFLDRTLRGDRLAPPRRGLDDVTERTFAESSPATAASGSTGPDSRHGATPAYLVAESATPAFGEAPVAVAALPVEVVHKPVLAVRSTPGDAPVSEGVTEAERGVDRFGRPAARLAHSLVLPEGELDQQQRCLAEAVYFEARGESERGQYAVAQVVMNRTRTGFYPRTPCKVVYQNRHRYNACQFSFACDRFPDRIYNRPAWALAQRIARDVTENGAWLDDVGGATHYHANYVRPYWRRSMIREAVIGRHIFYRARSLPHLGPPAAISDAGTRTPAGEAS